MTNPSHKEIEVVRAAWAQDDDTDCWASAIAALDAHRRASRDGEVARLREALERLIKYADWQIQEGAGYHPTLPSAVAEARVAIARAILSPPSAAEDGE